MDNYEDGVKNDIVEIKESLEDVVHKINIIFEDYDIYEWRNGMKYFMADLNALEILVTCAIEQAKTIIENHCDDDCDDEEDEEDAEGGEDEEDAED